MCTSDEEETDTGTIADQPIDMLITMAVILAIVAAAAGWGQWAISPGNDGVAWFLTIVAVVAGWYSLTCGYTAFEKFIATPAPLPHLRTLDLRRSA